MSHKVIVPSKPPHVSNASPNCEAVYPADVNVIAAVFPESVETPLAVTVAVPVVVPEVSTTVAVPAVPVVEVDADNVPSVVLHETLTPDETTLP
jgi:hypothetical protein